MPDTQISDTVENQPVFSAGWIDEFFKEYGQTLREYDKRMSDDERQRIGQMVEKFQGDSERWRQELRNGYEPVTKEVPEDKNMEPTLSLIHILYQGKPIKKNITNPERD